MKALVCREHGLPDRLDLVSDWPSPELGDNDVLIRVKAAGLNFPDVLIIQGKYQFQPELPFIPGGECAGVVEAVGAKVTQWKIGDEVIHSGGSGSFCEEIVANEMAVLPKPPALSFEAAAGITITYLTSYHALVQRANIQPGETLLVLGAAGGVGMAAVDLGKHMGAKVIATAGSDAKLEVLQTRGADHVINYTCPDGSLGGFREIVKELTAGEGADVIFDPVGGSVFDESMRCINWGGRILTIGFTSGVWPKAAVNHILIKQISVIGVRAGEIGRRDPALGIKCRDAVYELLASGHIDPYVCAHFPLGKAVDALAMLRDRQVIGKVVVTMNGYDPSLD